MKLTCLSTTQADGLLFHQVHVQWQFKGSQIYFSFDVEKTSTTPWHTSNSFSKHQDRNPGLWDYDVVEVFLQPRQNPEDSQAIYYEYQLSPLNQRFRLEIEIPRQKTRFSDFSDLQTDCVLSRDKKFWNASLQLTPAQETPWIYGNCFACLGAPDAREYWQLFGHPSGQPDFHQPKYFQVFK